MSKLDEMTFAPMLITDVFETMESSGAWYNQSELVMAGDAIIPFVSRTRARNGVHSFCPRQTKDPEPGCAITIGLDTQTVAFQPVGFYTGQNIQVLRHSELNELNGPVLAELIAKQMGRFSWGGNGATLGRLRRSSILIPVTAAPAAAVDWKGMTELGAELRSRAVSRSIATRTTEPASDVDLPDLTFSPMFIVDDPAIKQAGLFRKHKGKRLTKADRRPGRTPFVTGSRFNNSIADYSSAPSLFPGGWVTLIYNGDGGTGHAKYQPVPFNASDDVIVLEPLSPEATENALLVLVTILTRQCVSKFGFGYKLTLGRLERQRIMVPTTTDDDGNMVVDWEAMDRYGHALRVRTERALDLRSLSE